MENEILIKGKVNLKVIQICFFASMIAFIVCMVHLFTTFAALNQEHRITTWYWDHFFGAGFGLLDWNKELWMPFNWLTLILFIVFSINFFKTIKSAITVSKDSIVGYASFGKRVNLPMGQVSAIATKGRKSIIVATSSGKITFSGLTNRNEVYDVITDCIKSVNDSKITTQTKVSNTLSGPDEIKKYKDLLDQGIISAEEFEQKKKELLGL